MTISDPIFRMMLMKVLVVLILELLVASVNAEYVSVTNSSYSICKPYRLSKYETLTIKYTGAKLTSDCEITVSSYRFQNLCVKADYFRIGDCETTVKYYAGTSFSYMSLKETHQCTDSPSEWCPGKEYIKIRISKSDFTSSWNTNVDLEVSQTDPFSDDVEDIAHSVVLTTYVIIGIIVGAVVLIGIIVTIIICCVCNRRRSTSGTVYRNPQQATNLAIQPPPGSYPTAATTNVAYPYPQPGAYPQAGYQPPAQVGYQPGYQPPPQAGYQTAPNTDNKPASVPPNEFGMQPVQPPPPYSEN